ncbi:F-box/FBD/LRR-repeat protein-like protein [Tanacetum coccineum]
MSISLPTHIFYCVKLKHLKLRECRFPFAPSFTGFHNLLSLDLYDVSFEDCECWDFIYRSSLLEILKISTYQSHQHTEHVNKIDIGKLKNLKQLSLPVCTVDNITSSGVFQLMEFPPKLEELTLYFCKCKAETIVGNKAASSVLFCLKSLALRNVDFTSGIEASSIFQLIFSLPSLLTLQIKAAFDYEEEGPQSALNFDFASMRQLQLQSVNLQFIRDSENEVCLIKSLLACSPVLQKMDVHFLSNPQGDHSKAKLKFALKLTMEMDHGTLNTTTIAHNDVISTMPDKVISNILNRVPLHRVVRTSILSRNWRLKWTLITQVVFDEFFFDFVTGNERYELTKEGEWRKRTEGKFVFDARSISRILLHLKGDVTKFFIEITRKVSERFTVDDINHWVLFFSRNGIQEFTLRNMHEKIPLGLPTHIFSCLGLKHLRLTQGRFPFAPSFTGFPNLLSLDLYNVTFGNPKSWEFISRCPLLEILKISVADHIEQVEPIDIAKLESLKKLSIPLCLLQKITRSGVCQLIEFPPKVEELVVGFCKCKLLEDTNACKRFNTVMPCLKTLHLWRVDFASSITTLNVFQLIFGSPNLKTIKIETAYKDKSPPTSLDFSEADFAAMGQLQLQSVSLGNIRDSKNEVCLIKSLLACSPLLKRIIIYGFSSEHSDENGKLTFALKLLKLHRASPIAEILL